MMRHVLILTVGALLALTLSARAALEQNPFDAALQAPTDVSLYVHVEDAAAVRRALADRPIARWFRMLLDRSEFAESWTRLARGAGLDEAGQFDALLGKRFTVVVREIETQAGAEPRHEWALLTEVEPREFEALLGRLTLRRLAPRGGAAIAELPDQRLLTAHAGRLVLLGPKDNIALFHEMIPRLTGLRPEALAQDAGVAAAAEKLGKGHLGVFMRHDPPLGGWSAIVARLEGDEVVVNQMGRFDAPPLLRPVSKQQSDFSLLTAFERTALIAVGQPQDVGNTQLEAFISSVLDESLIDDSIRPLLGGRRILIVGEEEGRAQPQPVDLLTTSFAVCLEVNDAEDAVAAFDRKVLRLARSVERLGQGLYEVRVPALDELPDDAPRHIDISPAIERFFNGLPLMRSMSLNWTMTTAGETCWFVISTHRNLLDDAVATLARSTDAIDWQRGRIDQAGVVNGGRLSRHLRSWSDQPQLVAQPGSEEQLRQSLRLMSELAGGLDRCMWKLTRPTDRETALEVRMKLAPPESTRD